MRRPRQRRGSIRPNKAFWNVGSIHKLRLGRSRWKRKLPLKIILLGICIYLGFEILTLPFLSIRKLSTENPAETALMRQRLNEAHAHGTTLKIDQRWTALTNVPRHVRKAILVAEDGTFFSHAGIDWYDPGVGVHQLGKREDRSRRIDYHSAIGQELISLDLPGSDS